MWSQRVSCPSLSAQHTSENGALTFSMGSLAQMRFRRTHSRAPPANPGGVFARTSCGGRIGDQSDVCIYTEPDSLVQYVSSVDRPRVHCRNSKAHVDVTPRVVKWLQGEVPIGSRHRDD